MDNVHHLVELKPPKKIVAQIKAQIRAELIFSVLMSSGFQSNLLVFIVILKTLISYTSNVVNYPLFNLFLLYLNLKGELFIPESRKYFRLKSSIGLPYAITECFGVGRTEALTYLMLRTAPPVCATIYLSLNFRILSFVMAVIVIAFPSLY